MGNQGKVEGNSSLIRLCMCRQYLMAFHVDVNGYPVKVSATLKIAIFPYLRFQRFQIDMLESFL